MGYSDPAYMRAYQAEWKKRRREEWLKEHGPCSKCGSGSQLNVHHIDPSIKFTHKIWTYSKEKREAELAKCIVLCDPCHREHHMPEELVHGHNGYCRGCRCDVCREGHRISMQNWRATGIST